MSPETMGKLLHASLIEINHTLEENFDDDFRDDSLHECLRTLNYLSRRLSDGPLPPLNRHAVIRLLMEAQSALAAFRHKHFLGDPPYESESNVHRVISAIVDAGKEKSS